MFRWYDAQVNCVQQENTRCILLPTTETNRFWQNDCSSSTSKQVMWIWWKRTPTWLQEWLLQWYWWVRICLQRKVSHHGESPKKLTRVYLPFRIICYLGAVTHYGTANVDCFHSYYKFHFIDIGTHICILLCNLNAVKEVRDTFFFCRK